jgi:SAM-dependent methyltransferase
MAEPWNINIHYDGKLDESVPRQATSALDVGCGEGFLASRLARRIPHVVAIDIDLPVLERAKQRFPSAPVVWKHANILEDDLGRFDAVVSNATLHHLPDTRAALRRLRDLVRPGGTLAIVAFARPGWRHLPWELATLVFRGVAIRLRGKWSTAHRRSGRRATPSRSCAVTSARNCPAHRCHYCSWAASSSCGARTNARRADVRS